MFVSVDGTQATYEYVRFPGKWSSLANNIGRLRETLPGVQVQITLVLQAVNALNVVDVFDWADSENIPIQILIGRGLDEYNDFRIMPLAVRSKLRERFESYFARKGNRVGAAERQHVELILAEIDATDFSEEVRRERIKGFMHFINDMDKSRRLSFKTAAPELYDDVVAYAGGWDSSTRYA
jgi:sulfatase maturation enzyme AslB (radical SAM superfamily)